MCWLILCISLAGVYDAQAAHKTLWGMSVRIFLEEISIRLGRLSEEERSPSPVCVDIIQSAVGLTATKNEEEG